VDFEVPEGGSIRVYAAGPGTVFASSGICPDTTPAGTHVDCNGGNGNFVDIIHPDGRRTRYLHLLEGSVVVKAGDHVCRGCLIGRSGWSGNVVPPGPAGAHLHYEELIGYTLVPPGPMYAQGRSGRVTYPATGQTWQEFGEDRPRLVNKRFPRPGLQPQGRCFEWAPTLEGTGGSDTLRGTPGHDVILAGGGNDSINGLDGEDRVCGGGGDDVLIGGGHPDHIEGGEGNDTCYQGELGGLEDTGAGTVIGCETPSYLLTVTTGGQVVTSDPPGISCPGDCNETFVTHTTVTLKASPAGVLWAGCDTSSTLSCRVSMSRDRTVRT
jgi:Ca2+-binding RTX toxin-like protein